MKPLKRIFDLFRNSPTYVRDRVDLISAPTIGFTALILNGVVMCLVLPLMLDPNDSDFRTLTENVGLGQLLALILLGGATACATLVIPLRLISVFWGPRTGRYFDQVVLSGISPLRFVIGKAVSQNLFLLLVLFLLLPWLVMSLTLGGVHPGVFLAGLFLVWLYCMALALLTLWAALYMNELIAAVLVIASALFVTIFGLIPMPVNPFVMTPYPALIHPVYSEIPSLTGYIPESYLSVFVSCAACLGTICGVSLVAIYLGPLYGIISDNSTFGEVVRKGDSKKKRRFRLRLHIQRPSEIAFFYENRGDTVRPHEGLIRWGGGFAILLLIMLLLDGLLLSSVPWSLGRQGTSGSQWWVYEFHTLYLTLHGFAVAAAVILFSHARNTVFQKQPVLFGRSVEVARLDSICFLTFLLLSTLTAIAVPYYADLTWMIPAGTTIFPGQVYGNQGDVIDYVKIAFEGTLIISVAGLTVYTLQRLACLSMWLKSGAVFLVGIFYFMGICIMPLMSAVLLTEFPELRHAQVFGLDVSETVAPVVGTVSPMMTMIVVFGEVGGGFPKDASTLPFYVSHVVIIALATLAMRRSERTLRQSYFSAQEAST